MSISTPMEKLKSDTRAAHERLERNSFGTSLMEGRLTREDYRRLLAKFYGIYAPLEPSLVANPHLSAIGFDYAARQKLPALESDLLYLRTELAYLPVCVGLPPLSGLPETLGILYVVEGSTLGGQVLARKLLEMFGREADRYTRFFNSYGERVGVLWKSFGELVNTNIKPADEPALVGAATAMFSAFDAWLKD